MNARTSDFCLSEDGCSAADGTKVTVGGILVKITAKTTRNNKNMAFLTIEDPAGTAEVLMFPGPYEKYSGILKEGGMYFIQGTVKAEEGKDAKLALESIRPFEHAVPLPRLWIRFADFKDYRSKIAEIMKILQANPGSHDITFYLLREKQLKELKGVKASCDKTCLDRLTAVCGKNNLCLSDSL